MLQFVVLHQFLRVPGLISRVFWGSVYYTGCTIIVHNECQNDLYKMSSFYFAVSEHTTAVRLSGNKAAGIDTHSSPRRECTVLMALNVPLAGSISGRIRMFGAGIKTRLTEGLLYCVGRAPSTANIGPQHRRVMRNRHPMPGS